MTDADFLATWVPPATTGRAFKFGRRSAYAGHPLMPRHEFLGDESAVSHPDSLWRAYLNGHELGTDQRVARLRSTS